MKECFDKTDRNKDSQLDEAELNRAVDNVEQMLRRGAAALAKVKHDVVLGRWERFKVADANKDGKLSRR